MVAKVLHIRNATPGVAPVPANLVLGQLAINVADATLYTLTSTGVVSKIGDASVIANAYTSTNTTNQLVKKINGVSPDNTGNIIVSIERNKIMNGRFRVWQRTAPTGAINGFIADRWFMNSAGATVAQGTNSSATDFYYLIWTETAGTGTPYISQSMNDVTLLNGLTTTFSVLANPSKAMTITPSLIQNFGTSGSASVTTTGTPITLAANVWARYTFTFSAPSTAGKTIGANSYSRLQIATATSPGTFTLNMSEVQWESGPSFMGYEFEDIATTTQECLFYYEAINGILCWSGQLGNTVQPNVFVPYTYKRLANPSLTFSSIVASNLGNGNPSNIGQSFQGVKLQLPAGNALLGAMAYYNYNMAVDAELGVL